MPDNNFEDNVRKKMEELRFVPSGDVWTKVEENIREDRKRRRMFFWLPLTGLLAGCILWFAWPVKNRAVQANLRPEITVTPGSAETAGNKTPAANAANPSLNDYPSLTDSDKSSPASPTPTDNPLTATRNRTKKVLPVIRSEEEYLASVSAGMNKNKKTAAKSKSRSGKTNRKSDEADHSAPATEMHSVTTDMGSVNKSGTEDGDAGKQESLAKDAESVPPVSAKIDSGAAALVKNPAPALGKKDEKTMEKPVAAKKTSAALAKKTSKKNKIEWGFTASGGVSQQLEKNAIPTPVLARAFANSTVYVIQHSNLTPGPAFSAGFVASKRIGKTWRLQTGIQYAYASSRLPNAANLVFPTYNSPSFAVTGVGPAVGSGNFSNKSYYSNRYQFIQIPVAVEKQFGVNSPLSAQAGLNLGYLTGVHALIYQPLLDQYSSDNSKFNKFQVSGIMGVYWKFKIDPQWSLRAGPELQYQLSNFMKSTVSVNDHLLTGSVRIILLHSGK